MNAINLDPKTLETGASASAHAYAQGIAHVQEEINARDPSNLTALVDSLAPEGPYAYTILPDVRPDGSIRLPVLTTRESIHDAYKMIRGASDLLEVIGLTEIRGAWYLFQDNISRGRRKGGDVVNNNQTLALFPSGGGPGITGELVWLRVPRSRLGAPDEVDVIPDDSLLAREHVHEQYASYLDALRAGDTGAVLAVLHDSAASAVRDYVADTGTLVELTGKDAHRLWFDAFFARYEVRSVQPLTQVIEDWYVFAELRVTVVPRAGGAPLAFHTAEFHVPARDGRFIARIGHGTDPA